jgi:hypothetical protein
MMVERVDDWTRALDGVQTQLKKIN